MNTESKTPRTDDQSVRYYDDATGTRIKYVAAKFACQLERELAQRERERDEYKAALQSADNHNHEIATKLEIVTEQRDEAREQLDAERELANRLAEVIQCVMIEERDLPITSCKGFIDFDQAILALTKWKEARHES